MINLEQVNSYNDKGYLVVENAIPQDKLKELQRVTDEYVINSKDVVSNDEVYDLADDHSSSNPNLRRLKNPHLLHKVYENITKDPCILDIVEKIVGNNIRRDHTKLNFKGARGGESIEWHQDWAFYPHTNDDLITVGIYLDDCYEKNGPLKIIKNSHKKKLYSHHNKENYFIGKIDTKKNKIRTNNSISITGTAGTVVFFHCRAVHGSGHNLMDNSRPLILFGYRACDAWPLINDGNPHPEVDLENYDKNIIVGNKSIKPRLTKVPTIIPLPKKKHYVSIYELQKN